MTEDIATYLMHRGVKPTANRILVFRHLQEADRPLSLKDIEDGLVTLDKSSIFRALVLLQEQDVIHGFEDGRGIVLYELCHHHEDEDHSHGHLHFYCEVCQRSYCIEDMPVPHLHLPPGYEAHTSSWIVKGTCPACAHART